MDVAERKPYVWERDKTVVWGGSVRANVHMKNVCRSSFLWQWERAAVVFYSRAFKFYCLNKLDDGCCAFFTGVFCFCIRNILIWYPNKVFSHKRSSRAQNCKHAHTHTLSHLCYLCGALHNPPFRDGQSQENRWRQSNDVFLHITLHGV